MRSTGIFAAVGELLVKVLLKASVTNVDLLSSGKTTLVYSYKTAVHTKLLYILKNIKDKI